MLVESPVEGRFGSQALPGDYLDLPRASAKTKTPQKIRLSLLFYFGHLFAKQGYTVVGRAGKTRVVSPFGLSLWVCVSASSIWSWWISIWGEDLFPSKSYILKN